jgi:hypothetical protein
LKFLGQAFASVEFISAERTTESYQKQDFIVLVLVLVLELVALPQHSRFDHEHEHRFTEHEHVVVFSKLPTDNCPPTTAH